MEIRLEDKKVVAAEYAAKQKGLYLFSMDVKVGREAKLKDYAWCIYENYSQMRKALKIAKLTAECQKNYKFDEQQLKKLPYSYIYSYTDSLTGQKVKVWATIEKIS